MCDVRNSTHGPRRLSLLSKVNAVVSRRRLVTALHLTAVGNAVSHVDDVACADHKFYKGLVGAAVGALGVVLPALTTAAANTRSLMAVPTERPVGPLTKAVTTL